MSPAVAGSPRRAPAARWPLQPPRWRSAPPRAAAPRAPRAEAPPTRREGPTGHGLERAQTASRRSCWWSARRRRPQRTEYARTALRACVSSLARRCTHLTVHRCHQLWLPQIGVGCLGKGIAQAALLERVAHRAVEDQPAWSHVVALAAVASPGQLVRNWVGGDAAKPKSLYLPLAHPGVPTAGRQARNQVGRFVRNCGFTRHRSHLVLPPITQRA